MRLADARLDQDWKNGSSQKEQNAKEKRLRMRQMIKYIKESASGAVNC